MEIHKFCGIRYDKFAFENSHVLKNKFQSITSYVDIYKFKDSKYKIHFTVIENNQLKRYTYSYNFSEKLFHKFISEEKSSPILSSYFTPYLISESIGWFLLGLEDTKSTLFKLKSNKIFDRNILKLIIDYI